MMLSLITANGDREGTEMVNDVVRRFCLWLGWKPAPRDVPDETMISMLVAKGYTPEQARAILDVIEDAEIGEFLSEKFPPVKRQS